MSWRKEQRRAERGYHHGNLKEALLQAALGLIAEKGVYARPSPYGPTPTPITRRLMEEGRAHLLLGGPVRAHAPTHIIQGVLDKDVPWRHALALADRLVDDPVTISLVRARLAGIKRNK